MTEITKIPKGCKFVLKITNFGFELVDGKLPVKDGQLWKGVLTDGSKVEMAGNTGGTSTPYDGWSS